MKYEFYSFDSSTAIGETIERYPILDWEGWYAPKAFEFKHRNFSGDYHSVLFWSITLLRRKFCLRIEFNHGKVSPEQAYTEHHARRKAAKLKKKENL